jgi:ATP-dependent helicase/nuclease subunit B
VPEAGAVLDPCANGTALSVTELENAAECPFRFFLKRGLGIRPVDERERDRDVWLDPLTRGSELHDLYASLLRRCRDAGRCADEHQDGAWLKDLSQARLAELQREMPAATLEILERESKDFLADVELFLDAECRNAISTPIGFEVSFGRPLDNALEPLARAEAVDIDLGGGVTFRIAGRIDRIDQVGDAFEVLDYKTGGFWRDKWTGTFDGGRRLQHALYGLAAVELLRSQYTSPTVTAGTYYFSSHKGRRERVRIPAPESAAIAKVLGDIRELIVQGGFVHTPKKEDCRFCDYTAVCGEDVHTQAKAKLQDSRLTAYGRLAAHV